MANRRQFTFGAFRRALGAGLVVWAAGLALTGRGDVLEVNQPFINGQAAPQVSGYTLDIRQPVAGLLLNGSVELFADNALVRVVMVDSQDRQYLVYEAYPMIEERSALSLSGVGEETRLLPAGVVPVQLRIQLASAALSVESLDYTPAGAGREAAAQAGQQRQALQKELHSAKIDKMNAQIRAKNMRWTAGETDVSRLTYEEKKQLMGVGPTNELPNLQGFEYYVGGIFSVAGADSPAAPAARARQAPGAMALPSGWDWRSRHGKDWMTSVKNQGGCGSCWAFSAAGTVEAYCNTYYGDSTIDLDLSEQDLLSCASAGTCAGGWPHLALNYIKNSGIVPESAFHYTAADTLCTNKSPSPTNLYWIAGFKELDAFTDDQLRAMLITNGPTTFGIISWRHAIGLTGYGVNDEGHQYWTIKNSWGAGWGEAGYANLQLERSDLYCLNAIIGAVTFSNGTPSVVFADDDGDGYYRWGMAYPYTKPPSVHPEIPDSADAEDTNSLCGPFSSTNYTPVYLGHNAGGKNLAVSTWQNSIVLSWQYGTNHADTTGIDIWARYGSNSAMACIYSVDGNPSAPPVSTFTNYTDTNFPADTPCYYWVAGRNGGFSQGAMVTASPFVLTAAHGTYSDRITITWNNKAGALSYQLWRAAGVNDSGQATPLDTNIAARTYTDASVTAGVLYYYFLKANTATGTTDFLTGDVGWRSWSFVPTGIAASKGAYTDRVLITWTLAGNASSYVVYRNTTAADSGAVAIGSASAGAYSDTTATPGVTYYYWVKGVDASGTASGFSLPDSGWRATTPAPDPDATNIPPLRATDFQLSPASIQVGGSPSTAVIRIVNTSASATSAWVTLTIYLSGDGVFGSANNISLGSLSKFVSLAAGQSADLNLNSTERANFRVPSATALGYYTAFLKATTTPTSSTNNVLTLGTAVRVIASRLADQNDFDNDGKTDLAVYNASTGIWNIRDSATGNTSSFACGGPDALPVSGDYDGDGKADLAVYQASSGTWLFLLSGSLYTPVLLNNFGGSSYAAVSGDYDGDGKTDPAVYNAATGAWMVQLSGSGYATATAALGSAGCKPVSGDYDGDGKADPAVFQPANGGWQVLLSGSGYALAATAYGDANCVPISGDFDGDLKSDPAIYREADGLWGVMLSASGHAASTTRFGEPGFVQVSGDYDGDGKSDLTVYQAGYGNWYFRLSKTGYPLSSMHFGGTGFVPVAIGD